MVRIRWSEPAIEDVKEISAYIGRDSPIYADAFVNGLFEMVEHLEIIRVQHGSRLWKL